MIFHEIYSLLEQIDRKLERLVPADGGQKNAEDADEWLTRGLDSIMSFQAGKKRESEE